MLENIKTTFRVIGIVSLIFLLNSKRALNVAIDISEFVWAAAFIFSFLIFPPLSFIKSAKKLCSIWFYGTAILLFIQILLKVRYQMMASDDDSSFIGFLISLCKATFGAGFNVYWPLLMTLAWGYGSLRLAVRLEQQFNTYKSNQQNKRGGGVMIVNPVNEYETTGMTCLYNLSQSNYKKLENI